ncbi:hypothetical protein QBC43DRAFT_335516 [Cladorrhinum sp. PSN259]|nr:hypothetical protein QBC43DRAFT_335516 [Cladorrhinum sp. PSN259]
MAPVQNKTFQVVKITAKDIAYEEEPHHEAWVVNLTSLTHDNAGMVSVWEKRGSTIVQRLTAMHDLQSGIKSSACHGVDFSKGRPVLALSVDLLVCLGGGRPPFVYRTVHDGTPIIDLAVKPVRVRDPVPALESRGHNIIEVTAINFQPLFQKHETWAWRGLSPYLSTTSSFLHAIKRMALAHVDGCRNIRILKIDTVLDCWDHDLQPIFDVQEVSEILGFPFKKYMKDEFVVQGCIPRQAVVRELTLEDVMADTGTALCVEKGWKVYWMTPREALESFIKDQEAQLARHKKVAKPVTVRKTRAYKARAEGYVRNVHGRRRSH